jgi:hypothetical protein
MQEQCSESFYSTIDVVLENIFTSRNDLIMVATWGNNLPELKPQKL